MVNIAIHGLGRIGRAILRRCASDLDVNVLAINDLNPDADNLAYCLNFDSAYGVLQEKFTARDSKLEIAGRKIHVLNESDITTPDWSKLGADVVVDASGETENAAKLGKLITSGKLSRAFITGFDPAADFVLTLGCNESDLRLPRHRVIACNTCDATAIAPVLRALDSGIGVEDASLTILHPWLNHQNLLDSAPPRGSNRNYELGRAAPGNIIPKSTSAEAAIRAVLPAERAPAISAISYRVPTPVVACADLSIRLVRSTNKDELLSILRAYQRQSAWKLLEFNQEPLVSTDFKGSDHSAVLEARLLSVAERNARLTLWYDNESGYAARVLDQIRLCSASLSGR